MIVSSSLFKQIISLVFLFLLSCNATFAQKTFQCSVYFKSDQHDLDKEAKATIDSLNAISKDYTDFSFDIYGNTDSIGSKEFNEKLSEDRVGSVKEYMLETGIKEAIIKGYALGEEKAKYNNGNEKGRARNRRVDIVLKLNKIDRDTTITNGLLSIKIPANTFAPVYNDQLKIDVTIVNNYKQMVDNGLTAKDSGGNQLNSGGMACIVIKDGKGKPVTPTVLGNEIVIQFPAYEFDPNMKPYIYSPGNKAWKLEKLYFHYSDKPKPVFILNLPASFIKNGGVCINWDKRALWTNRSCDSYINSYLKSYANGYLDAGFNYSIKDEDDYYNYPNTGCKNPFAYRRWPRDFDTTAIYMADGSIIKFEPGAFAPYPIAAVTASITFLTSPKHLIRDSISSLTDEGKYMPSETLNQISFGNQYCKKISLRPEHKGLFYYHIQDTIFRITNGETNVITRNSDLEIRSGYRDTAGILKWRKSTIKPTLLADTGYRFLVFELTEDHYLSYSNPTMPTIQKKGKTFSQKGLYKVEVNKKFHVTNAYVVYTKLNMVERIFLNDSSCFKIKAFEKPSQTRLVLIASKDSNTYIFQSSISALKFKRFKKEYILKKRNLRLVRKGKDPMDMIK